ncbi:MAG: hypothetical protein SGCHY_002811 [Lobulomycetales sp.]
MVSRRRARRKEPEEEQPKAGNENVGEEEDEQPKAGNEDTGEEKVKLLAAQSMPVRMRNFAVRLIWTLVMLAAFAWLVSLGHMYVILLVVVIQAQIFFEVISVGDVDMTASQKGLPMFRFLNWYFLLATNYFLYGESMISHYAESSMPSCQTLTPLPIPIRSVLVDRFLLPLATHHRFISFSLYCMGFVLFILSLKKGFFFGRTPLIQLSPKKTWEGFIGAFFTTMIFGFFFSKFISQFEYMTCPMSSFYPGNESPCTPSSLFVPYMHALTPGTTALIKRYFGGAEITFIYILPVQIHALLMSTFASLFAPFGGFFASGMKRAFKIKDFGDTIPGHGGFTDRMDCQLIMGLFSYMYIQSFIGSGDVTVGHVLHQAVTLLTPAEQAELYQALGEYLKTASEATVF